MSAPTEAELRLLKILWSHDRLSARELQDLVEPQTGWSFSTTRKLLDRMVEKSLVSVVPVHGVRTFEAAQSRLRTMAGLIRSFSRQVLDVEGPLPVASFVSSRLIDEDEVEELEALLNELDEGEPT
ncbi:BlaI/MecI/CopY family transcriptional regulator [Parvularcula sp. LCG005]|uniref:BlaI/MecI/CopY family transcriptional regulator n=1 Tax=Parvularcula sp. LCG005 TaxID=3078805 RepID=UPI00294201C7|nr:BlaI/MecI/CopY family transcriptional regulator [Parvularcula sp. LCG005]WOI53359.1 BlaI/MecI/CopY family transcriptional regulator [Parvularcula sp. LCG005]